MTARKKAKGAAPQRAVPIVVRNEKVKTPSGEGRADKFRDPATGRYVGKVKAKAEGYARSIRTAEGQKVLERTSTRKVKEVPRAAIGEAFTDQVRPAAAVDFVTDAESSGKRVFVKIGGKVYQVPAHKLNDLRAFLVDMRSRFYASKKRT